jgi:hypothetical protein
VPRRRPKRSLLPQAGLGAIVHSCRDRYAETIKSSEHTGAKCFVLQAAQRAVGHTRGRMAGLSNAPGLILAAENAAAPRVTMAVWTATTQRGRGRCDGQQRGREDDYPE